MLYFFVVAPLVELQYTANGLEFLSIQARQKNFEDFLPVSPLFLLLPLILLTLSALGTESEDGPMGQPLPTEPDGHPI